MQVCFVTEKIFPNDHIVRMKNGRYLIDRISIEFKRKIAIQLHKEEKERRLQKLLQEWNEMPFLYPDIQIQRRRALLELQINATNIDNRRRAAHRTAQELLDICRCNDFSFFVTLTFDDGKIESCDETKTRKAFSNFIFYLRTKFPNLYYVCVPEYQERGVLHFHMLVGGVTMDDLGCVPAINQKKGSRHYGKPLIKNGKQIYNITKWTKGYSTLSVLGNKDAAKHYITKYITKQFADSRFFGKKRYYVSRNIKKPKVIKYIKPVSTAWDIDMNHYNIDFLVPQRQYGVFSFKGKVCPLYGFIQDLPACAVKMPQGSRRQTIRKSLLEKLTVTKSDTYFCRRKDDIDIAEEVAMYNRRYVESNLLRIDTAGEEYLESIGL